MLGHHRPASETPFSDFWILSSSLHSGKTLWIRACLGTTRCKMQNQDYLSIIEETQVNILFSYACYKVGLYSNVMYFKVDLSS